MLTGKKVLVIGLARSGKAAIRLLQKLNASIVLNEARSLELIENHQEYLDAGIEIVANGHPAELFERDFDFVVKNPGINYQKEFILRLKERKIEILNEVELGYRYAAKQNYYAITGTNGKTTTVTLIEHILKGRYDNVFLAGNVGTPYCDLVVDHDLTSYSGAHVVLELSNFQLLDMATFHPVASTIINLTPDHLDYMVSLDEYYESKLNIYQNQTEDDVYFLNKDDQVVESYFSKKPAKSRVVTFSLEKPADIAIVNQAIHAFGKKIVELDKIKLVGAHNVQNVMIAVGFALQAGVDATTIAAQVESFQGVAHRIEYVTTIAGVRYYNDSKGTNTDATVTAIRAFDRPVILLIGGFEKNLDISDMAALNNKIKTLVCYGATKERFAREMSHPDTHVVDDLRSAVMEAAKIAQDGDVVLLSPSTSSFDEFESYIKRGEYFKKVVNELGE
ncbi:MAG: UDP-N-acetylmuramoyl-L-alanine--D-glutamate ligase [Erysipelotrichaceae bacterium]|nr:UDP-N-acetylmuramoyl-L-alanine--D-glutamate ligase [Erysipelotrichaceae bacterium]